MTDVRAGGDGCADGTDIAKKARKSRRVNNGSLAFPTIEAWTQERVAREFATLNSDRARFDHDGRRWLLFDEAAGHWRPDRKRSVTNWMSTFAVNVARSLDTATQHTMGRANFAGGAEQLARAMPELAITADQCDADPLLLGTPMGTVDLRTGEAFAGRPADLVTMSTTTPPGGGTALIWQAFLREACNDDGELIDFLQMLAGYALTGDTREHALFFLHGDGGTGKGVFLRTIAGILGDYAGYAQMSTFCASPLDRHSSELAVLRGRRFVWSSENDRSRKWDEALIKQLSGGDPVSANRMRRDKETWTPTFKLAFAGNREPALRDVDDGIRRRFYMVPFRCKPREPDTTLEERLRAEWPAILSWAIAGCRRWQREGLKRPTAVAQATASYLRGQDIIGRFFDECCDLTSPEALSSFKSVKESWLRFAASEGARGASQSDLQEALDRRNIYRARSHGKLLCHGIRVRS